MRGLTYIAKAELPPEAFDFPGVRRTKKGKGVQLVPWHAYHLVSRVAPGTPVKLLPRQQIPTGLEFEIDPIAAHPFASEEAKAKATVVQREDLAKALRIRGGLIDHPCGSGKTLLGLQFATAFWNPETGRPYKSLVITPSTTVLQWAQQAKRWLTDDVRVGVVTKGTPEVKKIKTRTWTVTDDVRAQLRKLGAPETLRLGVAWVEDQITAEEAAYLRKAKAPSSDSVVYRILDDFQAVLGEYSTEGEARVAAGVWTPGDYDVLVVGWGLLRNPAVAEALVRWEPLVMVIDEAHRGKDPKRWRRVETRAADGSVEYAFERKGNTSSNIQLLSQNVAACLAMTATPQADLPRDWWGVLDLYDPYSWGSFHDFTTRYAAGHPGQYGWDSSGVSNVEELKGRLALVRFHRTKDETHRDMPRLRREFHALDLRQAGTVDYEALGAELKSLDAGGNANAMGLAVACEQKIPWALDRLTQYLREGLKVVVFTLLRASATRLASELQKALTGSLKKALVLHGDGTNSVEERMAMVQDLIHSNGGVLVGTIGAWGEAIDGLQHVDRAMVLTVPYTPRMIQQAEGRFERLGGKTSVIVEYVRMSGTMDDRAWALVGAKLDMVGMIRDDIDASTLGAELEGKSEAAEAAALESLADLLLAWEGEKEDRGYAELREDRR